MTRLQIEAAITGLNDLVLQGRSMDAFERYYHDDVIMQENYAVPTISKQANREREIEFYNKVEEFRGATVKGVGIGDNLSFVIWHYDYTHSEWGERNYTQVSIQQWKDGSIIYEQFIYPN